MTRIWLWPTVLSLSAASINIKPLPADADAIPTCAANETHPDGSFWWRLQHGWNTCENKYGKDNCRIVEIYLSCGRYSQEVNENCNLNKVAEVDSSELMNMELIINATQPNATFASYTPPSNSSDLKARNEIEDGWFWEYQLEAENLAIYKDSLFRPVDLNGVDPVNATKVYQSTFNYTQDIPSEPYPYLTIEHMTPRFFDGPQVYYRFQTPDKYTFVSTKPTTQDRRRVWQDWKPQGWGSTTD